MEAIHEMSKRRPNLDGITFSGQMYYENRAEPAYVCGHDMNVYVEEVSWPKVGVDDPPATRVRSCHELAEENIVRQLRRDAGVWRDDDVCEACGLLKEYYLR